MNKTIENLGLDSQERSFPAQFPPIRVEYAVPEIMAQASFLSLARRSVTRGCKGKMKVRQGFNRGTTELTAPIMFVVDVTKPFSVPAKFG